jgi:hypothetical protein
MYQISRETNDIVQLKERLFSMVSFPEHQQVGI